jgi:hypothetical protein
MELLSRCCAVGVGVGVVVGVLAAEGPVVSSEETCSETARKVLI